jgi:hypothetical protein
MNPQQQTGTSQENKTTAGQVADQARQKAGDVMDQVQQTAKTTVSQQKGRVAESMGTVAEALRKTGQNLYEQDQGSFGRMAEKAADRIEQFSDDLQNKSVDEMFYDVQNLARRDPQLFLGGAVVLGLLAARFLKSSGQRYRQQQFGSSQYYRSQRPVDYYGRRSYSGYSREAAGNAYTETYTGDEYSGFESNLPANPNQPASTDFSTRETTGRGTREFPASSTGTQVPTGRPERDRDNPPAPGSQWRKDE